MDINNKDFPKIKIKIIVKGEGEVDSLTEANFKVQTSRKAFGIENNKFIVKKSEKAHKNKIVSVKPLGSGKYEVTYNLVRKKDDHSMYNADILIKDGENKGSRKNIKFFNNRVAEIRYYSWRNEKIKKDINYYGFEGAYYEVHGKELIFALLNDKNDKTVYRLYFDKNKEIFEILIDKGGKSSNRTELTKSDSEINLYQDMVDFIKSEYSSYLKKKTK